MLWHHHRQKQPKAERDAVMERRKRGDTPVGPSPGRAGRRRRQQRRGRWRLREAGLGSVQWCREDTEPTPQETQGSVLPPSGHLQNHTSEHHIQNQTLGSWITTYSKVNFISVALYTTDTVSKQLHSHKQESNNQWLLTFKYEKSKICYKAALKRQCHYLAQVSSVLDQTKNCSLSIMK